MKGQLVARKDLSAEDVDQMFILMRRHFDGMSPQSFERDLAQKDWVIMLRGREDRALHGFSTLHVFDTDIQGEPATVVYSGDTIVTADLRGSYLLARAWIGAVNQLREMLAADPLYWLLLVSGYRTYRFLPVFWREFYPRYGETTPRPVKLTMDRLATRLFGAQYTPDDGIVRFRQPQVLRDDLGKVPSHRVRDPHVRFFVQSNASHLQGDELVCFTKLCRENLTEAGKRMWNNGARALA